MNLDSEAFDLYRRSRDLYLAGRVEEAEIIYRSLRRDHSVELFYEVELPSIIRLVHPLGTVLGRAEYAPYLVVYQGVSVGSTVDHERPKFTGPCVLFPHSGVIGPVTVGSNVWITAGTIVEARPGKACVIPDDSIVSQTLVGMWRSWASRRTTRSIIETFFKA